MELFVMDPITGGLLSGGANLLGSIFGITQGNQNSQQMQQQAEAYNTQMSSTAYQRSVADMKAAGLNPAMMFGSGGPESSPTIQPAQKNSAIGAVGPAVDKAISSAVQMKSIDKMAEEIANMKTEEAKRTAETFTESYRPTNVVADTQKKVAEASSTGAEKDLREAALPVALNAATTAKNEQGINPTVRKVLDVAGFSGRKVDAAIDPVANVISSARGAQRIIHEDADRR